MQYTLENILVRIVILLDYLQSNVVTMGEARSVVD